MRILTGKQTFMIVALMIMCIIVVGCSRTHNIIDACVDGDLEAVQIHIQNKTNLEQRDNLCRTPLMLAALFGRVAITKTLLNSGARIDSRDHVNETALFKALSDSGSTEIAIELLRNRADAHTPNSFGETPLMLAVSRGCLECLKLIVNQKVDPNAVDNQGRTALMKVGVNGSPGARMTQLLLESGADPKIRSASGLTAKAWALDLGCPECVVLLETAAGASR